MTDLAARLEAEIRPLLDKTQREGGYDCCGCSTYDAILDHAIRIVRESDDAALAAVMRRLITQDESAFMYLRTRDYQVGGHWNDLCMDGSTHVSDHEAAAIRRLAGDG